MRLKVIIFLSLVFFCFNAKSVFAEGCSKNKVEVIVRNHIGTILYDINFNILEQTTNVDGKTVVGRQVASGRTDSITGMGVVEFIPTQNSYAIQVINPSISGHNFIFFNAFQAVCLGTTNTVTLNLESFRFSFYDQTNNLLKKTRFDLYIQAKDVNGHAILGNKIGSFDTGDYGEVTVYAPSLEDYFNNTHNSFNGNYVLNVFYNNKEYPKYNILAVTKAATVITWSLPIVTPSVVVPPANPGAVTPTSPVVVQATKGSVTVFSHKLSGSLFGADNEIALYSLAKKNDYYIKNQRLTILKTNDKGSVDYSLDPGAYLFVAKDSGGGYGEAIIVTAGGVFKVDLQENKSIIIETDQKFYPKEAAINNQTNVVDLELLGIKRMYLNKIAVGWLADDSEVDSDADGLSDRLEKSLSTDYLNKDTDKDGFIDSVELKNNYSPLGKNKLIFDNKLSNRLKGRLLLQVETGSVWFINPRDGKRYLTSVEKANSLVKKLAEIK